jgi:citrate lyase beta subunit
MMLVKTTLGQEQTAPVLQALAVANATFARRFPGVAMVRQPVHTVYGGAHLYRPGAAAKLADLARQHLAQYAPTHEDLARAMGFAGYTTGTAVPTAAQNHIATTVFDRVRKKLVHEAVEDHRVDFEDGYGSRPDAEEDGHAVQAAESMAEGLSTGTLPAQVGIRIKALTEEAKVRALRTLDIFITALLDAGGRLPSGFVVTLPKVTQAAQVTALADCLALLEARYGITVGTIKVELMIETIQSIFDASGRANIPALVDAGGGPVSSAILGTFDYTASCNIASTWQDRRHPAADAGKFDWHPCHPVRRHHQRDANRAAQGGGGTIPDAGTDSRE